MSEAMLISSTRLRDHEAGDDLDSKIKIRKDLYRNVDIVYVQL